VNEPNPSLAHIVRCRFPRGAIRRAPLKKKGQGPGIGVKWQTLPAKKTANMMPIPPV